MGQLYFNELYVIFVYGFEQFSLEYFDDRLFRPVSFGYRIELWFKMAIFDILSQIGKNSR